jgi:hypothetical protein
VSMLAPQQVRNRMHLARLAKADGGRVIGQRLLLRQLALPAGEPVCILDVLVGWRR